MDIAYELFYDTWQEGREAVKNAEIDPRLAGGCRAINDYFTTRNLPEAQRIEIDAQYTIRAWTAVITFLLSDYHFLYE